MRFLVAGVSARAIAESAVRSGYQVIALDAFGDMDLRALCECHLPKRDLHARYSAAALYAASLRLTFDVVAYVSNLENHPQVVRRFARRHQLIGNAAETLTRVRHAPTVFASLARSGFAVPATIYADQEPHPLSPSPTGREGTRSKGMWLRKPIRSGGGHGITFWREQVPLGPDYVLQEYIPGVSCSASFVANGRECVVVGVTEQIIGRHEFGANDFRYCGNVLPLPAAREASTGAKILNQVQQIAALLTREFGLVGVNGFDFVLDGTRVVLLEVNPRYSASMELIERAYDLPMFDLHARAVLNGELPEFDLAAKLGNGPFYGKSILFAEQETIAPDTQRWLARGIRDVPYPGEQIAQGGPVCTVLATGAPRGDCFAALASEATALKREIYA
jgi:uncharacterized protein